VASARLSPANAGVVAANFKTAPLAQADVFAGQKRNADRLERARIGPATAGKGARRSASKSSIALALTEAAVASFATDQPSIARAERHWAAEIIALERAGKVRRRAIAITASVSRCPHNRSRLDRISRAICQSSNKRVVNPLCAVAPASGAPDHAPRATLEINDQLGARAESPESLRRTAHPKSVTRAKFTREVQKPLGIGVQSQQEKPCGARR
jgi:hypothetical protein